VLIKLVKIAMRSLDWLDCVL